MPRPRTSSSLRIGVVGAGGKMGKLLCAAVIADPDLELVAAVGRSRTDSASGDRADGGPVLSDTLDVLVSGRVDIAVDFTGPHCVMEHACWYAANGIHAVIGTTGLSSNDVGELRARVLESGSNMVVSPSFSLTGVLMQHAAKIAARHLDEVELFDIHPPTKADAPSGTTIANAHALARVRGGRPGSFGEPREMASGARGAVIDGIHVHAFCLSGAIGHVEARFAHRGDTLAISVTNHSREGYVAGTLMAIKAVIDRPGLTYGFEPILGLEVN